MSAKQERETQKSLLGAAASAALGHRATSHVLGYDKVHHGTSTAAAKLIRQTGLRKGFSGSGIGREDHGAGRATMEEVKGKVYTSKMKTVADAHQPNLNGHYFGATVTARVPHRGKARLATDHVFTRMVNGTDPVTKYSKAERAMGKVQLKSLRIYKHSIPSRFIQGSHDDGGVKQFINKGHMRRYLSTVGGKARFAKGVAMAAGSGASALYSVAHALKARKEAK